MAHGNLSVNEAVCFTLTARHFKRLAAHLTNIATSVILPLSELDYFDEKIISNLSLAANYSRTNSSRYKDIFEKCFDYYLEKKENLMKLSNSRERIHRYYSGKSFDQKKLFWTQTKKIAKYFKQQAQINGIRFEALHLALSIMEDSSLENISKKVRRTFMNSFDKN